MSNQPQASSTWGRIEQPMSVLGKFSWLIALGGVISVLISAIVTAREYDYYRALAQMWSMNPVSFTYQAAAKAAFWEAAWYFTSLGVGTIFVLAYVVKPFSLKCNAKDWEALIEDKVGGISRMWVVGILLGVFCWWGCIGVLVPALMLATIGPGKGRTFKDR